MARTHKVQRGYIDRIIEVRREIIPVVSQEVLDIGSKLGLGTYRSINHPDLKVGVYLPGLQGYTTDWKSVAATLAHRLNVDLNWAAAGHRRAPAGAPSSVVSVRVLKDTAKTKRNQF